MGVFSHHGEVRTLKRQTLVAVLALILLIKSLGKKKKKTIANRTEEANVLAVALFAMLGFAGGVVLKLSVVVAFGCLSVFSYRLHWRALRIYLTACLCALIVVYTVVVVNNAMLSCFV